MIAYLLLVVLWPKRPVGRLEWALRISEGLAQRASGLEQSDYRKRNFQVLRRTMATLAQGKGSAKDIQAHLRHAKVDTTANEYMQEVAAECWADGGSDVRGVDG